VSKHANGCGQLRGIRIQDEVNRMRFVGEKMFAFPRHVGIVTICETQHCLYVFAVFRRVRIIVEDDY